MGYSFIEKITPTVQSPIIQDEHYTRFFNPCIYMYSNLYKRFSLTYALSEKNQYNDIPMASLFYYDMARATVSDYMDIHLVNLVSAFGYSL